MAHKTKKGAKLNSLGGRELVYGYSFPEIGELELMRAGLGEVLDLLSYGRPHDSKGEKAFIRDWLMPRLKDAGALPEVDSFGNIWCIVPEPESYEGPRILWSCHVDTMHAKDERQRAQFAADGRTIELAKPKPGRCLGADDGAGLWLMLEMLRAKIPGGYVFHRGEERGRLGSEYVARHEPERLEDYQACIAFDRRDFADIITHQLGDRTCSESFARGLADALNFAGRGLDYMPDDSGSYTDSFSYADTISECTNVSVGYDSEHGPRETLDGLHLWRLREALLCANLSDVPCLRDPSTFGFDTLWGSYGGGGRWGGYGSTYSGWNDDPNNPDYDGYGSSSGSHAGGSMRERMDSAAWGSALEDSGDERHEREKLRALIERFPAAATDLMMQFGLGCEEMFDVMTEAELSQALALGAEG